MSAATAMQNSWKEYEAMSTQRFLGEKYRWKRAKTKEPKQKDAIDVPALIQRIPSDGATRPRPRYIVFPNAASAWRGSSSGHET